MNSLSKYLTHHGRREKGARDRQGKGERVRNEKAGEGEDRVVCPSM
jgi:hypothetical protein